MSQPPKQPQPPLLYLRQPSKQPPPVAFIDYHEQLPVGHVFECEGAIYTVTAWQYRNRLGGWLIGLVVAADRGAEPLATPGETAYTSVAQVQAGASVQVLKAQRILLRDGRELIRNVRLINDMRGIAIINGKQVEVAADHGRYYWSIVPPSKQIARKKNQ